MNSAKLQKYVVIESPWAEHAEQIRAIRKQVFIEEQQVPEEDEWDDLDGRALHLCIFASPENKNLIAYARLLPKGKLTRIAVLAPYRNLGLGATLVNYALALAKKLQLTKVKLDAQISAVTFYKKLGFTTQGEEFWDAGIKHIHMYKTLSNHEH